MREEIRQRSESAEVASVLLAPSDPVHLLIAFNQSCVNHLLASDTMMFGLAVPALREVDSATVIELEL